jgi:FkbM family methyltransferase
LVANLRSLVRGALVSFFRRLLSLSLPKRLRTVVFEAIPHRFAFVDGAESYVVNTKDKTISALVYRDGAFDFDKFEKAVSLLRSLGIRPQRLYDIGANIGTICIPAVKRGLVKTAVGFEPEPTNYRLLVANIHLNGLEECIVHHRVALGARRGEKLAFELSPDNMGDHRVRVSSGEELYAESKRALIEVPSETFDGVVGEVDAKSSLIWIDVQGYEGRVFEGARAAIAVNVPIVLEVAPYLVDRAGCRASLKWAVAQYSVFYNLSAESPVQQPIEEFDALFSSVSGRENADILLVHLPSKPS